MLSVYDLYDLHAVLCSVRCFPESQQNKEIVTAIISVLKSPREHFEANQFRKALRTIDALEMDRGLGFVCADNVYCYYPAPFLKNEGIYAVLIEACEQLLIRINENDVQGVYDLSDCLHDLPIFISENGNLIPRKFWNVEVKNYRTAHDRSFLKKEELMTKKVKCFSHLKRKE